VDAKNKQEIKRKLESSRYELKSPWFPWGKFNWFPWGKFNWFPWGKFNIIIKKDSNNRV
jgi:hypothetical protein